MKKYREREVIFNLPNTLTTFRLLCIPLVVICLRNPVRLGSFFAALFLLALDLRHEDQSPPSHNCKVLVTHSFSRGGDFFTEVSGRS